MAEFTLDLKIDILFYLSIVMVIKAGPHRHGTELVSAIPSTPHILERLVRGG